MEIKADDRIIISGLTGTGKTYLLRYFATQFEPDILIIDPLDQYSNFLDECRYIPKRETPNELEQICKSLWSRANVTLIIEESEQYLQQGRSILPFTSGLIRMGRNWGIGVFATTRRIQDLNKRLFDLAQHAFFFRCGLQSRDYIARMIGPEYVYPYPAPKYNKTGYTITTLPEYAFLHLDLKTETADVSRLHIEGREYVQEVGKKSEIPRRVDRGKMEPIEKQEEVQEEEEKNKGKEREVGTESGKTGSKDGH